MSEGKKNNRDKRNDSDIRRGVHFLSMINGWQERRPKEEGGERGCCQVKESSEEAVRAGWHRLCLLTLLFRTTAIEGEAAAFHREAVRARESAALAGSDHGGGREAREEAGPGGAKRFGRQDGAGPGGRMGPGRGKGVMGRGQSCRSGKELTR